MDAFRYFLNRVFTIAKNTVAITSLVPSGNITPSFDVVAKTGDSMIDYHFADSSFDRERMRGEGIFSIEIKSIHGENGCREIFEAFNDAITGRTISDDDLLVAMFRERPGTTVIGDDNQKRTILSASYDAKLVYVGA